MTRAFAPRTLAVVAFALTAPAAVLCCARSIPVLDSPPQTTTNPAPSSFNDATADVLPDVSFDASPTDAVAQLLLPWSPPLPASIDGPHEELALDAGRPIYYALPRSGERPLRLIGHLHGMCGPPPYACGKWIGAGTDVGVMVCPTGNARCGDSPVGPPSWEAPTWTELVTIMDKDLESSIAKVEAKRRGIVKREGAVLTGYSRGAYAAPLIARSHPGRWRFMVLIEANVPLTAASLRASGVRSVALVAGEQGDQIQGMTKTQAELEKDGFPAKLFLMKKTGHLYSEDMEYVMHDALTFVLSHDADGGI